METCFNSDFHFVDDPLLVVSSKPYFDDLGFSKERLSKILEELYG